MNNCQTIISNDKGENDDINRKSDNTNKNQSNLSTRIYCNNNFNKLKKYLNINQKCRKFELDSLLKRIKAKFFRVIHECILRCLKEETKLR